ncbi:MAG: hypothetical protein NWF04_05565 [Candidatus Bathyarchaeota archaeon]|nr:hypothetical protein [Candidatus Bathyarchaeota archaeon]
MKNTKTLSLLIAGLILISCYGCLKIESASAVGNIVTIHQTGVPDGDMWIVTYTGGPSWMAYHPTYDLSIPGTGTYTITFWASGYTASPPSVTAYVAGDMDLYVTFTPSGNKLTMFTVGQGAVSPGNQTYSEVTNVSLTATPESGWSFSGWSGDATGTENTTLLVDGEKTVTANFVPMPTITVIQGSHGTIAPETTELYYGESQNFTITPEIGYHIGNVLVDNKSQGAVPYYYFSEVTYDHNITATYVLDEYHLIMGISGSGSVSANPHKATYHYGDQVTLTASPNEGWRFATWAAMSQE